MPPEFQNLQSEATSPFVTFLNWHDQSGKGDLVPQSVVHLTPVLRTSGLLREISGEELKTLLLVLTFVTPNGHHLPTIHQLAEGLNVSSGKMNARLQRLLDVSWNGKNLLHRIERENGLHAFTPSPHVVTIVQSVHNSAEAPQVPAFRAAGRDAVIAASRAKYARPRDEVEREIAELNGWPMPGTIGISVEPKAPQSPDERARDYTQQRLIRLGVSVEQAALLLHQHSLEEIERQLDWLPYRKAKRPAGFIVAAIEGAYDEPMALRLQRVNRALDTSQDQIEPSTGGGIDSASGENIGGDIGLYPTQSLELPLDTSIEATTEISSVSLDET